VDFISRWRDGGLVDPERAKVLSEIETGRLFSVSNELRSFLYLGALLIVAGVGGTVKNYMLDLGPIAITTGLSAAMIFCFYYCVTRGLPYSPGKVEQTAAAFDYILFLGCAFWGILFSYLETHYHLLAENWDYYLLFSSAFFFFLAYRFDNRLVLATALSTLASWFGVRFSHFDIPFFDLRARAIAFGAAAVGTGWWCENAARIKEHFADTYYTIGLHVLFWGLLWGLFDQGFLSPYPVLVAMLTTATITYALRKRNFQYFLYGTVYGYIAASYVVFKTVLVDIASLELSAFYFFVSSIAVVAVIFVYRRKLEQDS
jgi:hypothetical protein